MRCGCNFLTHLFTPLSEYLSSSWVFMSLISCVRHVFFDLFAQHFEVTCGGCQKCFRENIFHDSADSERQRVLRSLDRLITFILICSVRQRVRRGLKTQKGSRPSASLFYGHIRRLAVSVTETASETEILDSGMYLLKLVLFLF